MTRHLSLSMTLLGVTLCACTGKTAPIDHTQKPPERDALAHFCKHMAIGPSAGAMAVPARYRQGAWAVEITHAAEVAKLQSWPAFQTALSGISPDKKQAWLETGVRVHGLQAECAVILKQ